MNPNTIFECKINIKLSFVFGLLQIVELIRRCVKSLKFNATRTISQLKIFMFIFI